MKTRDRTNGRRPPFLGFESRWLLIPLAIVACKGAPGSSDGASARPPTGAPLVLTWEQPYKLTAAGSEANATFFATKEADKPRLKLQASFNEFPKGTKIKMGADEGAIADGTYWSTLVDIKAAVVKQAPEDLKGPVDLGLELRIEPPGGPPVTTKLPKQDVKESLRFALLKARDGGLGFGASDVPAGKPRGLAVVSGYSDLDFVGSAKNMMEVDWVVVAEDRKEPRTTKTCSFKEGPSTLKVYDADAVAFDRRTGERRGEQVVKG